MSNTTYDFGFTFEDPTETVVHVREPYNPQEDIDTSDLKDEIMAKLYNQIEKITAITRFYERV